MEHLDGINNLIGQKINNVTVSDDKELITFETDSHKYIYEAYGDCCSSSWIYEIEDIDNLIGQIVIKIEENSISREEEDETLDIMNYDLYTEKGICKIDFRNISNGYYYCGNLHLSEIIEKEKLC